MINKKDSEDTEIQGVSPFYKKVLSGSFLWMTYGLIVSLITSLVVASSESLARTILGNNLFFWGLLLLELGVVFYLSSKINSLRGFEAKVLFLFYSFLSGLTLSVIFFNYALDSIVTIFFSTIVMFGLLALYGAKTKRNLEGYGKFAFFGLIGLVVALLVNLFLQSSLFDLILAWIGVIIFTILSARDVQKIKVFAESVHDDEGAARASVAGALTLYLDFVNLFLSLLRIFSRRR